MPNHLAESWFNWLPSLTALENLRFERCVLPEGFGEGVAEVHHFSDASSVG